jgi:hypothetical protein
MKIAILTLVLLAPAALAENQYLDANPTNQDPPEYVVDVPPPADHVKPTK